MGYTCQPHGATLAGHLCTGWEFPALPGLLYHRLEWKETLLFREEGLCFASCPSHQQVAGGAGAAPALAVGLSVPPPALTSFPDTHRFPARGSRATSYPASVSTEQCMSPSGGGRGEKEKKDKKEKKKSSFSLCPHHGLKRGAGWAGSACPRSRSPESIPGSPTVSSRARSYGPQLWSPMV